MSINDLFKIIIFYFLASYAVIASPSFYFQYYDIKNSELFMHLVTPTTKGDVFLRVGEKMQQFKDARLVGLFSLSVRIPCEMLVSGANIYWSASGRALIDASIPPQRCHEIELSPSANVIIPVRFFNREGKCWIDASNNTLWHTATEMSRINKATVYQNIYAIFIANRTAFAGEDINRLKEHLLRCPSEQLIDSISSKEAQRLFEEMLEFNRGQ